MRSVTLDGHLTIDTVKVQVVHDRGFSTLTSDLDDPLITNYHQYIVKIVLGSIAISAEPTNFRD